MAVTSGPDTHAGHPSPPPDFGTGRLFLADSRLVFLYGNHLRHLVLKRVFGVSRQQANLLTFVLAAGVADGAFIAARRAVRAPLGLTSGDALMGGAVLRESVFGLGGPASRDTPLFGTLLALGLLGGVARPGIRRAMSRARATEARLRQARISQYRGRASSSHDDGDQAIATGNGA